jgi:hypothetical protein
MFPRWVLLRIPPRLEMRRQMDPKTACDLITKNLHYRPGYTFTVSPGASWRILGFYFDSENMGLYAACPEPSRQLISLEMSAKLVDSEKRHAPSYESTINGAMGRLIRVDDISTEFELMVRVFAFLRWHEVHELCEWFKWGDDLESPFHPHTDTGRENFSQLTSK